MTSVGNYEDNERELVKSIEQEFPGFRLVRKHSDRLSRWIDRALRVVTFGGQREYLSRYHTVIGNTLYLPLAWETTSPVDRQIVLRHERVHLRQRRRLGLPLMAFVYFVPILPLGLSWGRARIEWEAYTETLRATAELKGLDAARAPELRHQIVGRFTGPAYGWMWPFKGQVQSWYDQVIAELVARDAEDRVRAHPAQPVPGS